MSGGKKISSRSTTITIIAFGAQSLGATLPGAWRYRVRLGLVGPVLVYCDWVR